MPTVLVVEDEFGIAELLDAILTDEGYRVLNAINGKEGMELLATERADLVFTDYMMPVMDGAALLHAMGDDPALSAIPVVLMSSMPEATAAERCSGYVTFLRKPFRLSTVVSLAAGLLGTDAGQGS